MNKETRSKILTRIGVTDFPEQWLEAIDDADRTGLRRVDAEKEDSALHCSAEWHFARFKGDGATLAPLLYALSFKVAHESKNFEVSGQNLAKYFNVDDKYLYSAVHLLVASWFWIPTERVKGKPTKYRPVSHKEWEEKHTGFCTRKIEHLFPDEDSLGSALFGCGLGKYFPNVLKGLRNTGATDDAIVEAAKQFMAADGGRGDRGRRQRFQAYLRERRAKVPT